MNLKTNLRRILIQKNMTAAQLCRNTGVPKTTLSEWMSGSSPRDIKKLKRVADSLGLTIDELCFGDNKGLTIGEESLSHLPNGQKITTSF
jgi:transcriptional regulator with XRE-family HTH domain